MKKILPLGSCFTERSEFGGPGRLYVSWGAGYTRVRLWYRPGGLYDRWYVRLDESVKKEAELANSLDQVFEFLDQHQVALSSSKDEIEHMAFQHMMGAL